MRDLVSLVNSSQIIPIVAILGGFVMGTIVMALVFWRSVRQSQIEASLKHDMLERGMSADEIDRVLKAKGETQE